MNTEQREQGTDELAALVRAGIHSGIGAPGHGRLADGALDALLARLSAVEQEREEWKDLAVSSKLYQVARAAEARVEAVEQVLRDIRDALDAVPYRIDRAYAVLDAARAVLAPSPTTTGGMK